MGGRSSVSGLSVTVFGATGFTGRYIVNKLGQIGSRIVVPYRGNDTDMMHLKPMADLGQIYPLKFHLRDKESIYDCVKDSDVVVNLIAQDRNSLNFKREEVNVEGAQRIAEAARETGAKRLIHVSSLLATADSPSRFQQSKAQAESAVRKAFPGSILVRPSSLFGYEDRLLNLIGLFSAIPLGYPVINHGKALRHPLYVGDFAEAITRLAKSPEGRFDGKSFDLLGPNVMTHRHLIDFFIRNTLREHPIINMPPWLLFAYSRMFPEWRRPPYTMDGVRELLQDEGKQVGHLGFAELGIGKLQTLNELALSVIRGFRPVHAYPRPLTQPDSDSTS